MRNAVGGQAGAVGQSAYHAGGGVAAGGAVRNVMELAGIDDVTSKRLGSNTPINVVRATFEGLKALKSAEEVAKLRGVSVDHLAE